MLLILFGVIWCKQNTPVGVFYKNELIQSLAKKQLSNVTIKFCLIKNGGDEYLFRGDNIFTVTL